MNFRNYTDLSKIDTFEGRYIYLKENSLIGDISFGHNRVLNQAFYNSPEWKRVRRFVILRDNGCDMGLDGYPINGIIIVHHMNTITLDDIRNRSKKILDPEFLVCVSKMTHYAITYGDPSKLPKDIIERFPNDMCPWK